MTASEQEKNAPPKRGKLKGIHDGNATQARDIAQR